MQIFNGHSISDLKKKKRKKDRKQKSQIIFEELKIFFLKENKNFKKNIYSIYKRINWEGKVVVVVCCFW